jgi:uncharacterized membrane protein SpoIIM required for sporulation
VNLAELAADRSADWSELDALSGRARRGVRRGRLSAAEVRRLATLYRGAAADLAYARRRDQSDPIVARLERTVAAARLAVYRHERSEHGVRFYVTRGYWQRVRERPRLLLLATLLLLVPAVLAAVWAWQDPAAASRFVPGAFESVTRPRSSTDLHFTAAEQAQFASQIMTNNITVAFFAFVGGFALGLGTAWVLVTNGLLLGVVAGLAVQAGNGSAFFQLVVAHGVLELSCIVVAGLAGLRIGTAIALPGYERRSVVVGRAARAAAELVVGTALFLVVAGLVEGFVTPRGFGLAATLVIGFALGGVFWALVVWRGSATPEAPDPYRPADRSRSGDPLRSGDSVAVGAAAGGGYNRAADLLRT